MVMTKEISAIIPKKRGKTAQIFIICSSIIILFVGCYLVKEPMLYLPLTTSVYLILIIGKEVYVRICLVLEEWNHLASRYDNDCSLLLRNAFSFSNWCIRTAFITFIYLFSLYLQNVNPFEKLADFGVYPNLCALFATLLFSTIIELDHGALYEAKRLEELCGLDYGASMAYSYFHGFLQIVLPNKGTEQKGIHELMRDFESNENIEFAHNKLIVLIPMSLYCPPNLEDHSKVIDLAQSLGEIKLSRGGVHERIYKNTAYKIRTGSKRLYVCAEYATPLKTLHEIISNNNEHSNMYKKHKNELIVQFYLTLRYILDNAPDCTHCCDLVLFNDKRSDNSFEDVGEVILDHLRKQEQR